MEMRLARLLMCAFLTIVVFGWIFLGGSPLSTAAEALKDRLMDRFAKPTPSSPPKDHIYFLKTQDVGSSALQGIFARYAWKHNLVIGLPKEDIFFKSYCIGERFSVEDMQPTPQNKNVSMILHQMIFDDKKVSSVLPSDTIFITSLRDPAYSFPSVFERHRRDVRPFTRAENVTLEGFLREPNKYFKGPYDGQFWWVAKNGMFFDLGFDNLNENKEYIYHSIIFTEITFHLVLITEYFDMGLILLKNMLHWSMEDIIYVSMDMYTSSTETIVSDNVRDRIYEWNKADTALYQHFNRTFWKRVEEFGMERMERELNELNAWKKGVLSFCFGNILTSNQYVRDGGLKMLDSNCADVARQYMLRQNTKMYEVCRRLILPELSWWKIFSARQSNMI